MRKLFFCLALLLLIPAVSGGDDEIYYSTYLKLDSEISSTIEITRQPGASIDYVKAELFFFPKNDKRQTVLQLDTEPEAEKIGDAIVFNWGSTSESLLRYKVESKIQVENKFEKVYDKIEFPVKASIPPDIVEYLNPTEKIDSGNRDIVELANMLAEGEDDLFVVVHNMASWVKENIEYSLSTVTAEVTQKASWVLDKRYGVCDELTALFMAMCRSVGIPTRFVSGIAYTNDPQFAEKWGPHGWSEVYFPGYGWIPFDVTYGELGWIDPSHIKLSESLDPDKSSGRLEWRGNNFDVSGGTTEMTADITETGGRILDTVEIITKIKKDEVGFGSYNLVETDIKNLRNYYVTTDISLSAPEDVEIEGLQNQQILLKPGETKKIFWIIKISPNLERKYVYTFPLIAYNQRNTSHTTEFKSAYGDANYEYGEISTLMGHLDEEEEKEYSRDISMDCSVLKAEFYVYEENTVECSVENLGNAVIDNLNVCLGDSCQTISLTIAQEKNVVFDVSEEKGGPRDLIVTASNAEVSKAVYVPVVALDRPSASVDELMHPTEMKYGEKGLIEFLVVKGSFSDLYSAKVKVRSGRVRKTWEYTTMAETMKFMLAFNGADLAEGDNDFSIIVEFEDRNGKSYSAKEDFSIKLKDLTMTQKILSKVKGIGFFIINIFS